MPDELAARAKAADVNVSALTRAAIAAELRRRATNAWLDSLPTPRTGATHNTAMAALDAARGDVVPGLRD